MLETWKSIYTLGENGWFDFEDLYDETSKLTISGDFVEIGSWMGMSYTYLAIKSPNRTVWAIDTFQGDPLNPEEQRRIKEGSLDLYSIFKENCKSLGLLSRAIVQESSLAAQHFQDESCAFIFVDGGHSYEQVIKDLKAWYPKLKEGGIIAGHDYDSPGVIKAVKEFFDNKAINTSLRCWKFKK